MENDIVHELVQQYKEQRSAINKELKGVDDENIVSELIHHFPNLNGKPIPIISR